MKPPGSFEQLGHLAHVLRAERVLVAERRACSSRPACDSVSSSATRAVTFPRGVCSFSPVSRGASVTWSASRSRGPSSIRTGTPRSSHSLNLKPGRSSSRSSTVRGARPGRRRSAAPPPGLEPALVVALVDRHDHHLDRRERGWQPKSLVVAVGHDHAADQTSADTPRGRRTACSSSPSRFWNCTPYAFAKF